MLLRVDIREHKEGVYAVKIEGRLDTDTYQTFQEKIKPILKAGAKAMIVDMQGLKYISSAGLGAIFGAQKAVEENSGIFIMTNLEPQIRKVFEIVHALKGKPIFGSMEEVDAYLDSVQKKEITKRGIPGEI